jgi:hypothetical protein
VSKSGLVLVHHNAPENAAFRMWLEKTYFPAILPIMGVKQVTRLRSTDALAELRPYLTVLHTDDVARTVAATRDPVWQTLASEAVSRGVARRQIIPYEQLFELEA